MSCGCTKKKENVENTQQQQVKSENALSKSGKTRRAEKRIILN